MTRRTFCDGQTRRDFLRVGTVGAFGASLTLPHLLQRQALASAAGQPAKDVSLIYLFLKGGLSTIDTWDMKPDAPAEFRGEFSEIDTNVPGIRVCEHTPRLAKVQDKFSLVRSFRHHDSGHGPSDHYMLTGYFPRAGFNPNLSPNNQFPSVGSVIARKLGPRGSVPPYVFLPKMHPSGGSAYLGANASPFVIDADPNAPGFAVPDLVPPPIVADRIDDRRALLNQVDRFQKAAEAQVNRDARSVSTYQQKAFDLMTSPEAKRAFDITAEPTAVRAEYGRTTLGQSCLMARRLVEAGVRCVSIEHTNWDTHDNNFKTLKEGLLPALDRGLTALLTDLERRGMLDSTLVLVSGEFGRTPRVNKGAGRDHWGPSFTVALAGGGIKGGRAVGKSDARAERPATDPYGPEDLFATLFHLMGIDGKDEFLTPEGRPVMIVNNGKLIDELL